MAFIQGDDAPLTFHWHADETAIERLGLPQGTRKSARAAKASIIAALLMERDRGPDQRRISYSRRRDWYADRVRYEGAAYSYNNVVRTIDALAGHDYVTNCVARPGAHLAEREQDRMQSVCWANDKMAEVLAGVRLRYRGPTSPIMLRDAAGDPVAYRETERTRRLAADVDDLNSWLGTIDVGIADTASPDDWQRTAYHLRARKIRADGSETWACVRPTPRPLVVRIFGRSAWDLHGRYYGFWQGLPKVRRAELTLNGMPVEEPDLSWLHPTLLYAMAGCHLAHDPYQIPGVDRRAAKVAFNAYVNAPTATSTVRGLLWKRREIGADGEPAWKHGPEETRRILEGIEAANEPIRHLFGSDAGMRLMHVDSGMARSVMRECRKARIPCLPVHDSFIAPAPDKARVEAIMRSVLAATIVTISQGSSKASFQSILHNAPVSAGPTGVPRAEPKEVVLAGPTGVPRAEPLGEPLPGLGSPSRGTVGVPLAEPLRGRPAEPVEVDMTPLVPDPHGIVAPLLGGRLPSHLMPPDPILYPCWPTVEVTELPPHDLPMRGPRHLLAELGVVLPQGNPPPLKMAAVLSSPLFQGGAERTL